MGLTGKHGESICVVELWQRLSRTRRNLNEQRNLIAAIYYSNSARLHEAALLPTTACAVERSHLPFLFVGLHFLDIRDRHSWVKGYKGQTNKSYEAGITTSVSFLNFPVPVFPGIQRKLAFLFPGKIGRGNPENLIYLINSQKIICPERHLPIRLTSYGQIIPRTAQN
jgi:hypothetical protein